MQTDNRLLDDLTRIATGALGTLQGAKTEAETIIRQRLERLLSDMDLVTREEFEAVREMAIAAREENAQLRERIEALERTKKAPAKKAAKPRASRAKSASGGTKSTKKSPS
jgi:BMFP domain-containing protein YqiC